MCTIWGLLITFVFLLHKIFTIKFAVIKLIFCAFLMTDINAGNIENMHTIPLNVIFSQESDQLKIYRKFRDLRISLVVTFREFYFRPKMCSLRHTFCSQFNNKGNNLFNKNYTRFVCQKQQRSTFFSFTRDTSVHRYNVNCLRNRQFLREKNECLTLLNKDTVMLALLFG